MCPHPSAADVSYSTWCEYSIEFSHVRAAAQRTVRVPPYSTAPYRSAHKDGGSRCSAPHARAAGRLRLGIRPVHLDHGAPLHFLGSSIVWGSRRVAPTINRRRRLAVRLRLEGPDVCLERLDHSVHLEVLGRARAKGWAGGAQVDNVEVQRVD